MRILVLIGSYFPYGVAISSRIVHFCKLFNSYGANVHVISLYSKEANCKVGDVYRMEGYTYEIATTKGESSYESFFGYRDYIKCAKEYLAKNGKPNLIFLSGVEPYFSRIFTLFNGVPIYLEQCEWMDKSSYRFGSFDYRFVRRNYLLKRGYRKVSGVVSISRLLEQYYKSLKVSTVRVPTILDVLNTDYSIVSNNTKVRIVYTGNPSTSKELFKPVFETLKANVFFREKIEFHIYGPSEERVLRNIGNDNELYTAVKDCVFVHGKVPQKDISTILKNADFQMFIRPHRRSSEAGFPTKLAESMTVGTPVITNDTGDIGLYLKDGDNGFLLSDITKEAVEEAFKRVVQSDETHRTEMRLSARKTAESSFDYRNYVDVIRDFFQISSK